MDKEVKSKTTTPQFVYGLEGILDELVEKEGYMAQIRLMGKEKFLS